MTWVVIYLCWEAKAMRIVVEVNVLDLNDFLLKIGVIKAVS